jgi:general secretion pathway protein E
MEELLARLQSQPEIVAIPAAALLVSAAGARAWIRSRRKAPAAPTSRALSRIRIEAGTGIDRIPSFRMRLDHLASQAEPSAVDIIEDLFAIGFSLDASDIHMTPVESGARVSIRVHGVLYDLVTLPPDLFLKVVSRIKVLAALTLFKKATPQDGQIDAGDGHRIRVSVIPTNRGEKIVLRLAAAASGKYELDGLGLHPEMHAQLVALLNANQGMIIVTGPTGSGKTTTMYASLMHVHATRGDSTNTVTLEDPVEFDFPEFSQTQIDPANDVTFATGLRSILRQDPDVILVGEIRDDETAEIALRASMTGHLIFTTVHADSASGVFNRIIQMGIQPYHMASAVKAVLSQRLCKRLCPHCRVETEVTDTERRQFELMGLDHPPEGPFFTAPGCDLCLDKGFNGRTPVFEMLVVTDTIRDLINDGKPTHVIERAAREAGMHMLLDDGLARARAGDVSLTELLRVVAK